MLIFFLLPRASIENISNLVKIILLKSDNCALTLQKRLFCVAKQPLLPCKTYAFGMQNNRFCNTLIKRWLNNRNACEKYLQFDFLVSTYKTSCFHKLSTFSLKTYFNFRMTIIGEKWAKKKRPQTRTALMKGGVVPPGIEPGTQGFSVLCSTN